MKFKPFPELTNLMLREQCEISGWYWLKCKLKGAVYSPNLVFRKSTSHQFPPVLKKLKVATAAMSTR